MEILKIIVVFFLSLSSLSNFIHLLKGRGRKLPTRLFESGEYFSLTIPSQTKMVNRIFLFALALSSGILAIYFFTL